MIDDFFNNPLIDSNDAIKRLISCTLVELIYYWKVLCEYGRIVCIAQSIIGREFTDSWRWLDLIRVEFPIIEVDIPRFKLCNSSSVHLEENHTSWKSATCPYFITILIEYQISHWFIATYSCEYFVLVREIIFSSLSKIMNYPLKSQQFCSIYKSDISLKGIHVSADSVSFFYHLMQMNRSSIKSFNNIRLQSSSLYEHAYDSSIVIL